jgi:CHAT domain-containing protein
MTFEHMRRGVAAVVAGLAVALASGPVLAKGFNGFNNEFNLGLSATSGAVCKATRNFDDPLTGNRVHAWDVTCRGWSANLGRIYLFEGASPDAPPAAWRAALAKRASCDFAAAKASPDLQRGRDVACKLTSSNLDYAVVTAPSGRGLVIAEGRAPIADVLVTGVKFVSGAIQEPAAVAEQKASISSVTGVSAGGLSSADEGAKASVDTRREAAYRLNQEWRFSDAEAIFAELGSSGEGAASGQAEALYNSALNASNQGRFQEADAYFRRADQLAANAGVEQSLRGTKLNYMAADARNRGGTDPHYYQTAVEYAEQAVVARRQTATGPVAKDGSVIRISDSGGSAGFSTVRLTQAQRDDLKDVQALEIEATSLEILGTDDPAQLDKARAAILRAIGLLNQPLVTTDAGMATLTLGDASLWLNTLVRADLLRLDLRSGRAEASMAQLQTAIKSFRAKYPDSLPLAGFLVELARAEHAANQDEKALADYEDAFAIFRNQRGSLGPSADLIGAYFDILLQRIGADPAAHAKDVGRFFDASQTLVAQSSADAAKREAARIMSSNSAAAGLSRAIEDIKRNIEVQQARIRELQERGAYQGEVKTRSDAALRDLQAQSQSLEGQLLQADPKYASTLRNLVELDELQKKLQPGEVYVKVFMLANRGYGMLVTPTSARPYAVDLSRAKAEALIDKLREPIEQVHVTRVVGRFDVALAHQAFVQLFGPVQADMLGAKLIIYEPDSSVIGLPLSTFVIDEASTATLLANLAKAKAARKPLSYAGVAWLGSRIPSSISLSASAFVQIRAAAASKEPEPFYGFAAPQISSDSRAFVRVKAASLAGAGDFCEPVRNALLGLESLPQTEDEVRVVAASLHQDDKVSVGQSFTDAQLLQLGSGSDQLHQYRVLYFATHGVMEPAGYHGCLKPALVTSLGASGDGLIDVEQIPQLNLDADMVVLSACDTGRAQGGGGEAVGGLVTTFVQAGARNVVVSNWSVDSVATERLMTSMFTQTGISQAEALARAEQTMMASPDQYSNPFYWAAFTIVGDGARPMPRPGA